jgi:hypothetical protein
MVGVAPPARPAPPAEVRELGAAGRAVARRCEARAEGHRRGRGHRLEGVRAHASPHWRKPRKRSETRPRAHDWEARTSGSAEPACGDPRSARRAFTRRAPLAEFLDRHSTRVLAGSNGAPPSMSAVTWSSVRSRVGCAGCSGPSPGQTSPCWPTWRAIIRPDRRVHRGSAWTWWLAPMPDRRGCSPQRPVGRLVTTPQTAQSFTR